MSKSFRRWSGTLAALAGVFAFSSAADLMAFSVPLIDLDDQVNMQKVIDQQENTYLGHPSSVMLDDGKTIICVYPQGHGKGPILMKKSTDQGWTWSDRLPVPESWATSKETPILYRTVDKDGKKRIILWSSLYPARYALSEDEGETWSELKPAGEWGGVVGMASQIAMKEPGHYMAFFHDDGRFFTAQNQMKNPVVFTLYTVESFDGGVTWEQPKAIYASSQMHLCEPGVVRSPDGKQLAMLLRENSRRENSQIMFSNDEGKTWSAAEDTPWALTGDRHQGVQLPDGRLVIAFRDMAPGSPTRGHFVAWVGPYAAIRSKAEKGTYRIKLLHSYGGVDCGYPGVHLLPDGTVAATTYIKYWNDARRQSVVCVRFRVDDADRLLP